MTDARRTARTETFAADHLGPDLIGSRQVVTGRPAQIGVPVADLLRAPGGPRDRQLLLGDEVMVYDNPAGPGEACFVQAAKDGYVGYLDPSALTAQSPPTHWFSARASHAYCAPDFKSPDRLALSLGSRVTVLSETGRFAETPFGFIPLQHLTPLSHQASDPVELAQSLLGCPYLWGGNSVWGIDCSGLIQIACLASGIPCAGDSDQQEAELGTLLPEGTTPQRGDLLFWMGHVAWVFDANTLLHANVHHMAVAFEPLSEAVHRIEQQGDGPVTAHKRLLI